MNNKQQASYDLSQKAILPTPLPVVASSASCERAAEGHCITCSDEALQARVLRVEAQTGIAFVIIDETITEVDITLLDEIVPGNILLVHGGVAIAQIDNKTAEVGNG